MSTTRRSRVSRVLWGVLTVVLLGALVGSVSASRSALRDAESAAQDRAASLADTVLSDSVTAEQMKVRIDEPDYWSLMLDVQSRILTDGRIVRVRIWNPDDELRFSSDQRDRLGAALKGDALIEAGAAGRTVSATATATARKAGLSGSHEDLYRTFVPLRSSAGEVIGVAEIDQRYAAVAAEANKVWRSAQFVLLGLLVIAGTMFALSLRRAPVSDDRGQAASAPATASGDRANTERIRKAEEVAKTAAERAAEAEQRAAESDAAVTEAIGRLKELEERAQAAEERAQAAEASVRAAAERTAGGEVRRGVPGVGAVRAAAVGASAAALEARLRAAEQERDRLTAEIEQAAASASRIGELESELTVAGTRIAELEAELGHAEATRSDLEGRLARTSSGVVLNGDGVPGKRDGSESAARATELEAQQRQTATELQRAQESLANTQVEAIQSQKLVKELEAEIRRLRSSASARVVELEPDDEAHAFAAPLPTRGDGVSTEARSADTREEVGESDEAGETVGEEGLSLRERLARAEAARHRSTGTG